MSVIVLLTKPLVVQCWPLGYELSNLATSKNNAIIPPAIQESPSTDQATLSLGVSPSDELFVASDLTNDWLVDDDWCKVEDDDDWEDDN